MSKYPIWTDPARISYLNFKKINCILEGSNSRPRGYTPDYQLD